MYIYTSLSKRYLVPPADVYDGTDMSNNLRVEHREEGVKLSISCPAVLVLIVQRDAVAPFILTACRVWNTTAARTKTWNNECYSTGDLTYQT